MHLAYNAGRIFSYTVAGAIAGALGAASLTLEGQAPIRLALYLLANLMLVALGLYLLRRIGLVVHARQAAIKASNIRRSPGSMKNSGCHCTPRQKR